jgi:uncharacterized protein (TIGR02246 family)
MSPRARQSAAADAAVRRVIDDTWARALDYAKAGDAAALATLYTPDAILVDPSAPTMSGRPALETYYTDAFHGMKFIDQVRAMSTLEVYRDVAIENGTLAQTTQAPGRTPTKSTVRYTIVWKHLDGKWLVHRDVATPMPSVPTKK